MNNHGVTMLEVLVSVMIVGILSTSVLRMTVMHRAAEKRLHDKNEWAESAKRLMEELKGNSPDALFQEKRDGLTEIKVGQHQFSFQDSEMDPERLFLMHDEEAAGTAYRICVDIRREKEDAGTMCQLTDPGAERSFIITPGMIEQADEEILEELYWFSGDAEEMEDDADDGELEDDIMKDDTHWDDLQEEGIRYEKVQKNLYLSLEEVKDTECQMIHLTVCLEETMDREEGSRISSDRVLMDSMKVKEYDVPSNGRLANRVYVHLPERERVELEQIRIDGSLPEKIPCYLIEAEDDCFRYEEKGFLIFSNCMDIYTNVGKRTGEPFPLPNVDQPKRLYSIQITVYAKKPEEDDYEKEIYSLSSTSLETAYQ